MTIVAIVIFILAIFAIWKGFSCEYDWLFTTGIFVLVVEVVIAICALVYYLPAKYICGTKAEILGMEYKFDFWGGCFIRNEKGWFEYNQQRVIR